MSCEQDIARQLRATGRRFTVQRLRVAHALRHAGGHRTAEQIRALAALERPRPPLPLSTVYRALAALTELRLVSAVAAGDRTTYEWVDHAQPHHHLVCERCGAEQDADPALLAGLAERIRAETGFQARLQHVVIGGCCARCAAEAPARTAADGERQRRDIRAP